MFGGDYQATVDRAFSEGWIDVYENEGKRSGAFSAGVYGVHPYMLLNYADTLNDAFTVAHEMGHTMHTVLSHETQPYATSSYSIFVAEVASMTNESLFLDRLLAGEAPTINGDGLQTREIELAVAPLERFRRGGDADEIMIIGGSHIYRAFLPRADRIYMTRVHADVDGDTWFPELPESDWIQEVMGEHAADGDNAHACTFMNFDRR